MRSLERIFVRFLFLACLALRMALRIAMMAAAHPMARGGLLPCICCTRWHQPGQPPCKNADSADCSLTPACHFGGILAKNAISAKNKNEGLSPRLLSVFLCVAAVKPYSSLECGEASRLWNSLQDFIDHIGCPLGVQPHHTGLHIRTADHRQGHGVGRTEFYDVDTVVSALKIG